MPIVALPLSTSQLLGSFQVLTNPTSLVKELLDNALDAGATSVDIIVSTNTVDKIELRDNGHGIASEDFKALGKRGFTSKLRSFDDLSTIGGSSLGFRGEALASALELGDVSVTTRTEGEPFGTVLKLQIPGRIASQSPISHPVGTTVCMENFLKDYPVRKKIALKDSAKTLLKIKALLQSYALARPNVRFSLRLLKTGKPSWSFVPRPGSQLREFVSLIFGKDTAAHCVEKIMTFSDIMDDWPMDNCDSPNRGHQNGVLHDLYPVLTIHACLIKPNADFCKVGKGQYISIDGRPVSCVRGTLKKVTSIYKLHLRSAKKERLSPELKDPFMCLNIACATGTYDPNIEPAKDAVLFENDALFLKCIEKLFENVYGTSSSQLRMLQQPKQLTDRDMNLAEAATMKDPDIQPLSLLSAKLPQSAVGSMLLHERLNDERSDKLTPSDPQTVSTNQQGSKRSWAFNMSDVLSEEIDVDSNDQLFPICHSYGGVKHIARKAPSTLNPWIISKLNTSLYGAHGQPTKLTSSEDVVNVLGTGLTHLPSPRQLSEPNSPLEVGHYPHRSSPIVHCEKPDKSIRAWLQQHSCNTSIVHPLLYGSFSQPARREGISLLVQPDGRQDTLQKGHLPARSYLAVSQCVYSISQKQTPLKRARVLNKPFASPLKSSPLTTIPNCHKLELNDSPQIIIQNQINGSARVLAVSGSAQKILDNKGKTPSSNQEPRASQASGQSYATYRGTGVPHYNDSSEAIKDISREDCLQSKSILGERPMETLLPDEDPRAYARQRHKSISGQDDRIGSLPKSVRPRTVMLPLETVPEYARLHNVVHVVHIDQVALRRSLMKFDHYLQKDTRSLAIKISSSIAEFSDIEEKVANAFQKWRNCGLGAVGPEGRVYRA